MKAGDQMYKEPKSQLKHVLDNTCRQSVWWGPIDPLLFLYRPSALRGNTVDLRDIQSIRMKMCGMCKTLRYWLTKMTWLDFSAHRDALFDLGPRTYLSQLVDVPHVRRLADGFIDKRKTSCGSIRIQEWGCDTAGCLTLTCPHSSYARMRCWVNAQGGILM